MKKMAEGMTPEGMQEEIVYIADLLSSGGNSDVPAEMIPNYLRTQAANADRLNATVLSKALIQVAQGLDNGGTPEQAYEDFKEWMGMSDTEGEQPTFGAKTAKSVWEDEFDPGAKILVSSPTGDFEAVVQSENPDGTLQVTTMSGVGMDVNIVDVVRKLAQGGGEAAKYYYPELMAYIKSLGGDVQGMSGYGDPQSDKRVVHFNIKREWQLDEYYVVIYQFADEWNVQNEKGEILVEGVGTPEQAENLAQIGRWFGKYASKKMAKMAGDASGEFLGGWQTNAEGLEIGDQVEVQKEVNGFRGEVIPAGSVGTVSQLYTYGAGVVFEEGGEIVTGYDFLKKVGIKTAAGPPANTVHWGTVLDAAGNTYEVYVDSSEWGESGTGEKQYFGWTTLIDETGKESYFGALEQLESQIAAGGYTKVAHKTAAWQDWQSAQGVEVVTKQGADIFDSLEEAQKVYPTLDPEKNTKDFTWAMAGQDGRMRFESWEMYEMLSSSKKAGRADDKDVTEEDVEPKQLDMGREVEKEHHDDCPSVDNEALATEISLDHLSELPDYYDRLKQMEEEGKSTLGEREDLPTKTRWCELCQNPAGEFDDVAWEKRLHLCDMCLHEGFGEKKIWDLAASRQKKSDLVPPEITEIIELFRNTGVEDFQTWEGIAPGEWKITWQDDETKLPYLLTVSPNGWTFVAEGVHVQRRGFDYPPKWDDLQSVWGEARNAWEALHGDEYQPIPGAAPYMGRSTVDPGSMLAGGEAEPGRYGVMSGLGSIVSPIKMAGFDDETVSPLHRFYQERNIPGDPQRLALEAGVSKVHEVLGKFNKFLRLMGIQFERIEATRYAGTDKHIDRGRVWLKAQVVAGAPIARRATLSIVVIIKDGEVCDAAEFIDASQKHRLLNEASLKAYLNLQETPAIMRGPNVERAQIDRTILPPTPAKSLFHGRGGVDA